VLKRSSLASAFWLGPCRTWLPSRGWAFVFFGRSSRAGSPAAQMRHATMTGTTNHCGQRRRSPETGRLPANGVSQSQISSGSHAGVIKNSAAAFSVIWKRRR